MLGAFLIGAFHALDLVTFSWAISVYPITAESNSVAVGMYMVGGLALIAALKFAAICATWLIMNSSRGRRWRGIALTATGFVAGAGTLTNVVSLSLLK